jgi:hypothetical protein
MKKTINFLAFLALIILFSCNKTKDQTLKNAPAQNNSTNLLDIIDKYFNYTNTKVDGKFMFESNLCNNDPTLKNIALVGGVFYDKNGNKQTGTSLVTIGNYKLLPNSNGTYGFDKIVSQDGLFGTDVTFSIIPPDNSALNSPSAVASAATTTVYSPVPISISNIPPRTPIVLTPNASTQINWNADSKDSNGVIILGEYIPSRYVNKTALSNGHVYVVESSLLVSDNGSYAIPWSFFSKFPGAGHVILWVARGNYSIASNGVYNYQVGGYTAAAVWDVTVPLPPPLINGSSSFYFSFTKTSGNGSITATPGSLVHITVYASGPPNGSIYPTTMFTLLNGVQFTTGGSSLTAVNTSTTVTFTMPPSGSASWQGTFSEPYSSGSGGISVY